MPLPLWVPWPLPLLHPMLASASVVWPVPLFHLMPAFLPACLPLPLGVGSPSLSRLPISKTMTMLTVTSYL